MSTKSTPPASNGAVKTEPGTVRSQRLQSFKVPRDLSLGSTGKTTKDTARGGAAVANKKVFTPNLNVTRNKSTARYVIRVSQHSDIHYARSSARSPRYPQRMAGVEETVDVAGEVRMHEDVERRLCNPWDYSRKESLDNLCDDPIVSGVDVS